MTEIWKDICGYEGLYQVSTLGRVKSLSKYSGCVFRNDFIKKTGVKSNGYEVVCLSKNGIKKTYCVHRLVAVAFIPCDDNRLDVNHIDGNKLNNTVVNLEWCSRSENVRHAVSIGLNVAAKGERNGKSKLTESDVVDIRLMWKTCHNYSSIARAFCVNPGTIWAIINGKSWRYVS